MTQSILNRWRQSNHDVPTVPGPRTICSALSRSSHRRRARRLCRTWLRQRDDRTDRAPSGRLTTDSVRRRHQSPTAGARPAQSDRRREPPRQRPALPSAPCHHRPRGADRQLRPLHRGHRPAARTARGCPRTSSPHRSRAGRTTPPQPTRTAGLRTRGDRRDSRGRRPPPQALPIPSGRCSMAAIQPNQYQRLVADRGWSHRTYEHWQTQTMLTLFIGNPPAR